MGFQGKWQMGITFGLNRCTQFEMNMKMGFGGISYVPMASASCCNIGSSYLQLKLILNSNLVKIHLPMPYLLNRIVILHIALHWCSLALWYECYEPLTRYVKLRVAHAPGMLGTFCPPPNSKETASSQSWHALRRVRNPQFCLSGKMPMEVRHFMGFEFTMSLDFSFARFTIWPRLSTLFNVSMELTASISSPGKQKQDVSREPYI